MLEMQGCEEKKYSSRKKMLGEGKGWSAALGPEKIVVLRKTRDGGAQRRHVNNNKAAGKAASARPAALLASHCERVSTYRVCRR
jgi:hypothetical protein